MKTTWPRIEGKSCISEASWQLQNYAAPRNWALISRPAPTQATRKAIGIPRIPRLPARTSGGQAIVPQATLKGQGKEGNSVRRLPLHLLPPRAPQHLPTPPRRPPRRALRRATKRLVDARHTRVRSVQVVPVRFHRPSRGRTRLHRHQRPPGS